MTKPERAWDEWREEWGEPETAEMTLDEADAQFFATARATILNPITLVIPDPPASEDPQ